MLNKFLKMFGIFTLCAVMVTAVPTNGYAEEKEQEAQVAATVESSTDSENDMDNEAEVTGQPFEDIAVEETEAAVENETEIEAEVADLSEVKRNGIIEFAKQFLGKPYVWGGVDPNKGADCSGFTYYVMKHTAGVNLSHSSRAQVNEGKRVSTEEMRPGDLVFYGNGKKINHVAIYAGDGQVIHASTEKTGVKFSKWNYRTPIAIVNVLGD